ncbi:MAG: bacterioferritin [Meiothermus silvanus]|nr:bacterioferritin [Allomeiothermus silvanus]
MFGLDPLVDLFRGEEVLEFLQEVLTAELTAINQYFLHAQMCRNWGYHRLYEQIRRFSIEEMRDAEETTERILELEGLPNFQRLGRLNIGQSVPEQLQADLNQEQINIQALTAAIQHCTSVGDFTTRRMLEKMVSDEEEHVAWIETQLSAIQQVGLENYLAAQLHD